MTTATGALIHPRPHALASSRQDGLQMQSALTGTSRTFAFAVVFVSGWYLCLPETDLVQIPWWAAKHVVGPNILIHEVLFAAYFLLGGLRVILDRAVPARYTTMWASVCLVMLAAWCSTASLPAPFPIQDTLRGARLVLMSFLVLATTHWAAKDPLFILRTFLLALVAGTIANLVLTFMNPVIMAAGILPRLLGQNSPGPPMGIAVCLSAWLILVSRQRSDAVMAMVIGATCAVGAMISYSKTGMGAAAMGVAAIMIVSLKVAPSRRGRLLVAALFALVAGAGAFLAGEGGQPIRTSVAEMLQQKLESAQPGESTSMNERWAYVLGVGEIISKHPFGVGYSGFRDAMMQTAAFHSGFAAEEASISADESNPHSMFLHYASAGGVVGGSLAIAVFCLLCWAMFRGLGPYGLVGTAVAALTATAYFILAISVPYLFVSGVMLIPAALGAGLYAHVTGGREGAKTVAGHPSLPAPASQTTVRTRDPE